jgi:serine/threonine protein kinase
MVKSNAVFSFDEERIIVYSMIDSVNRLITNGYVHLAVTLDAFLANSISDIKLGNLVQVYTCEDLARINPCWEHMANWPPEYLLGVKNNWKALMAWSLALVVYHFVAKRPLFVPESRNILAQLVAIEAVLGSPPRTVRDQWFQHHDYAQALAGERESILDQKLDAEFPREREPEKEQDEDQERNHHQCELREVLKHMIRQMLNYQPTERMKIGDYFDYPYFQGLNPGLTVGQERTWTMPECPSMRIFDRRQASQVACVPRARRALNLVRPERLVPPAQPEILE